MSLFTTPAPLVITCNKHLAPYVAMETAALGFTVQGTFGTGVRLTGTVNDCIRLNLSLRCASQVLYHLQDCIAADGEALYTALVDYPWEKILPEGAYFSVSSNVQNSTISNNLYANLKVKDAVVDRLRKVRGMRPSTGADLDGVVFHLHWKGDDATVFLDTSGPSLARHGYRKLPGRAPMLEALAAATILSTKWDRRSAFINPMCGSGTLAIEAALIATGTAPGLFRSEFAFMHLAGYDENAYFDERGRLENAIQEEIPGLRIIATDYSSAAIDTAKKNARAAGVADLIEFSVCDFRETPVPEGAPGVMIVNPEYGDRLGEVQLLEAVYAGIGDFMKSKLGGYWGYVFTGNLDLAKHIGLKTSRRTEFYNARIEARLLEYELYAGSRRAAENRP